MVVCFGGMDWGVRLRELHNPSIVRRGNHFIQIDGKWALIDGPWFRYLESFQLNHVILDYAPPPAMVWDMQGIPYFERRDCVMWERIMWHPGHHLHPQMVGRMDERWNDVQWKRVRGAYIMLPDGGLPAFLNHREWIGDEDWADSMMQMGN